jgi:hypothetical protein
MRCRAMVSDHPMQADHCPETPCWTGRAYSPAGGKVVADMELPRPPPGADGPLGVWTETQRPIRRLR